MINSKHYMHPAKSGVCIDFMDKTINTKLSKPFTTESGHTFAAPEVAFKTWGKLNKSRDNVILICHALTGNADADDWFPGLFEENGLIDMDEHFVICINVPGSCYGSIGPSTINPETGNPYQGHFPEITIRDMVRFQQQVLDELEIKGIEVVIGGSMGGMQALEFAIMDSRVRAAIPIAMGKAHTPWAIGISHVQRQAIYNDPDWNDGFYNSKSPPERGLANARMMAMLTYRAPSDYEQKFGRNLQDGTDEYQVESYLSYQGEKLINRFDANSYVILTRSMDTHDVARGRKNYKEVLGQIKIPVLIVGIDTDLLYPVSEQKELHELIPNSEYREITSPHGHDAFLIEFEQLNKITKKFLKKLKTEAI
jgi:homoserine O-acetyltransferase/O-succinyltransferase